MRIEKSSRTIVIGGKKETITVVRIVGMRVRQLVPVSKKSK